ncbi:hypothetical protein ACIP93_33255 [Streptomyces sp. NPDC088745]|uniref:hypothetical protein n=1 Tax=Streptomyces sp. NPDC088745 TaxID=3365884 RepID=UPI0038130F3D
MLNRPAAAHAELQDLSDDLEVKAARRRWNPALHPRDSKGRFIETGGTVRLWGGKLARVVRALPNDRILVQDQTAPNVFNGRRHTTSAKWVSMVARPDGSAPTDNEDKVQEEDEKRVKDPRRGNGVARDDDGDPDTPNDPHDADDRGQPIGDDDDPVGPHEDDDQDEPADGTLPVNVRALPNKPHDDGARFGDVAAVRQHFLDLARQPGQKPGMAQFLRSVAGDDDPLHTTRTGHLVALRDDATGRWYLTATGTGQRMDAAGDFSTPAEALAFGQHLHRSTGGTAAGSGGFDFSDPGLDQAARTWRSPKGENILAAIKRARQEFPTTQPPKATNADGGAPETTAGPDALKPGDRVKVTVNGRDIEWPDSTRDQDKPETVTLEGTVAPTYDKNRWAPLLDATLTAPDGTVMTSEDSVRIMRTPKQYAVTGHTDGFTPEKVRADRVRVGDIVAGGEFGHVITDVRRYPEGRTFTARNLGGRQEITQFGAAPGDSMNVIPRARRRPEDAQRDAPGHTQRHLSSKDAKGAAQKVLKDWAEVEKLAGKQWPDGAPEEFRALAQHMQNVTDSPKGADGYQQNADAMHGALAAIEKLDKEGLKRDVLEALQQLEGRLDENADRFAADARAISENKRKRQAEAPVPAPDAPAPAPDAPAPDAPGTPSAEPDGQAGTVTLSPDEVSQQLDAVRPGGSKAPSSMKDRELRDEIVSLMEQEMANGGELQGVDRTRLRVLEAEEARRSGRKPKEEPKPKPKTPAEEGGGLFDVAQDEPQPMVADPDNPLDRPDDPLGTPDMFAAAEGRDTSKLRPVQTRRPLDFQRGDRFVDADGRTHTVAEEPVRTGRGRIRVVSEDGREHFLAPDNELRVLHPDEDAPEAPQGNASADGTPSTDVPEGDAPSPGTPAGEPPADAPEPRAPEAENAAPEADAAGVPAAAEPAAAPDQVTIDHSGTGTVVRFPTPNGTVSDAEFDVLRSLGFKASRDRSQPRFFYLPSNMTLSRRADKVRRLKEWMDGRGVAYQVPERNTERPELSEEQLEQLKGRYSAPAGAWATTDFRPGDEVWTGSSWDTVDSVGPKNLRLQGRGSTPYNSVLARRRDGEIRTMFDEPADDGTPRPGATDAKSMRDDQIAAELEHLRGATLPEGNDPAARTVRRQVSARINDLTTAQSERSFARRRDEMNRRDQAGFVRDPQRIATKKGQQVQGRDGAPIGVVYQEKKGKWLFVDRDGRTPTAERYPSRAAAITALNKITDARNNRAGEGWKHSAWDDVQPGDTVRLPELGRNENSRGRTVTGWSEPLDVSEIRRGDLGQVLITGRRGDDDVEIEVPRTDATFGASKPGTVPERERSEAGGGMPWQQMSPDDFGQEERPAAAAAADPNAPRPTDEFGTPDLIASSTPNAPEPPEAPEASDDSDASGTPGDETATAPAAPIRDTSPADMTDEDMKAELEELQAWQNRHVASSGEGPRVQGSAMLALSPVANRREKLAEEQRKRDLARRDREKKEKEKQERAAALARAEIGKRNADGSYPVTVDGEDAGTVRQSARKWEYTNANGDTSRDFYKSRADAVAALVSIRDVRREDNDRLAQQDQARHDTPDGWALGDRDDIAQNDIIRVPRMGRDRNGRPYPEGWGEPARVSRVERWDDGTVVVSHSALDGSHTWGSPLFLRGPDDTFAWASDRTRPEPTPKWHYELRVRMADIGDDIATLQNREGLQDPERIQRLQDLIQRVSRVETEDLQSDLRQIRDEAAWLEGQFNDPDLELPYETRRSKSWATAARRKAEAAIEHPDFQNSDESADGPNGDDDRAARTRTLFGEGMNAVGGDSLPEMQELDDRLDRADSAEDREAELRDIADRMDALAEQYELAGPQGELAADRFRRAARIARGEQNDRDSTQANDDNSTDEEATDGQADGNRDETTDGAAPDSEDDKKQDDEQNRRQRSDGDRDAGAADPDGEPEGGGAPQPPGGSNNSGGDDDSSGGGDDSDDNDDAQDTPEDDEDDEERRRRRRRNRRNGNGGPGTGGPGGPGGPRLPRLNLPDSNTPSPTGDGSGNDGGDGSADRDGNRARRPRHRDVDSLRNAWRNGDGLTPDEDTPERRALLADLADREGLALSPEGGLALYPDAQPDGTTVWRFVQARNGTNLPGITLTSDDPDAAQSLAGRFEEITDRNGDPFDWHQAWGPASIAAWRDGEGRNLPQALRAAQDDYEQERSGAFTLPEDLTTLSDPDLEAVLLQGLGPEDELRVMAEMDRRDGYVDERIRAAVPDTPPQDAEDAERRGQAMDEALGFGGTDVTRPAPATPGRLRREYDALDEERFQAAMQSTGGRLLSPEAEADGVDPRDVFSGGRYSNKRARELASPELADWWEGNGRLTYPQYRQREADRVLRDDFALLDDARYRAALDFTNGYFFKREYKYQDLPFNERDLFSGGALSPNERWRQYASDELLEWYDLNGGRLTFNQYKQQRRDGDRIDRQQFEEEQRQNEAPEEQPKTAPPFTAADVAPAPAFSPLAAEGEEEAAFRFGGRDRMKEFADRAELRPDGNGGSESVWLDGRQIGVLSNLHQAHPDRDPVWDARPFFGLGQDRRTRSQSRDTALANLVVRALQDGPTDPESPSDDVWDTVTVHLAGMTRELPELPEPLRNDPEASARYERLSRLVDAFRDQRSPSGNLRDDLAQARDDFAWLRGSLPDTQRGGEQRRALTDLDTRAFWAGRLLDGLGSSESDVQRPRDDKPQGEDDTPNPPAPAPNAPTNTPEDTVRPPAQPTAEPDPDPIGGQPAHWARVDDLVPGDMVRMNGTTKKGEAVQRAGYVQTTPELVNVTRRGRTDQMWRTWVTENPDGTGAAGNVYTSLNATAARAEAPDDVVPGSPASGAQVSLRAGNLPNRIPVDRNGQGLFPGSTVTGTHGREGTVTGATDTTVSVRWSDGNDEDALAPTALTVTDSQRPDGWTADGQRVTPQNIVSDIGGTILGPVDEVDGDTVTITTANGSLTRSAGALRVAEVRDNVPAPAPVTGIDEPVASDLKEGDVVVLDLDGTMATVAITSPPSRDGDRVTLQYADTTTGEMGEIDVDARAVLPRAQGPDGGAPELGPDDAPAPDGNMVVHPAPVTIDPVTGPTVDPDLDASDRNVIGDRADSPADDPDAHQAAARLGQDLPVTVQQAAALAAQLRAAADPSTADGRAMLRAADHLDRAAGRPAPEGLHRPRPSNVAHVGEGDTIAMPDERRGDAVRVFRVIDVEDGPGGLRRLLLEDQENQQWRRRVAHGAMPVWQLPEAAPGPVTPPDADDSEAAPNPPSGPARPVGESPNAPATPDALPAPASTPPAPSLPIARVRPGSLRTGDVIDAPVSRTGYQLNGHRRLTIISEPRHNGWWMQLTGVDEDGNVHDFALHNGRDVNVYDRNRPTPALPPAGMPRDPNQVAQSDVDRIVNDHVRGLASRIVDEAIAGTEPSGDIHALREQIAQRLTNDALRDARKAARRDGSAALDAANITGQDRTAADQRLRDSGNQTHTDTVRAALRTINDLEPLPGESNEDLAARARDLLRLIPGQVAGRQTATDPGADPDITRTVTGHAGDAVNALLRQLQTAGVDPGDAERIARILTQHMGGSRQATARRVAARVAAASPDAGRQPGLLARVVALLIRMAKRLAELVKTAVRKIAEKYRTARERVSRLRAFLRRMVRRVRQWPESRRLARLHRAVSLPDTNSGSLAGRISHWAGLMPEPGRFGQAQRRVSVWRPTTWGQLAAGRLPERSDRIQWTPDRAADGGPGLAALRHMAALRAAGTDVDQDVTRRLSAVLGDDFGDDPHAVLQDADDHVADSERRLVNLQAARSGATIPDDPDLEIEITAARAELSSARREYADMRARYAAAVPDAVAAALADLRDMGPEGNNALVFGPDTTPDAERAVRDVQRLIPRAWLDTPGARRITAVNGDQGRYEPDGQRITVADLADGGLGTAGHALAQHFARHLGDLDAAQRTFWFTRTHTGRPGARRMRPSALDRLLRRQQTQRETGDSLARSIQAMFSGDWYQDDDLRAFLLGLMATR